MILAPSDSCKVTDNLWASAGQALRQRHANRVSAATGHERPMRATATTRCRRFMIKLGSEAVRVGQGRRLRRRAHPATSSPPAGAAPAKGDSRALEQVEALMLAGSNSAARSDDQRPSMGQDMLKGRRTEIEFINGFIVETGRSIGLKAPANAAITETVQRVYRGELPASPENGEVDQGLERSKSPPRLPLPGHRQSQ